jgi:hypothetical protein
MYYTAILLSSIIILCNYKIWRILWMEISSKIYTFAYFGPNWEHAVGEMQLLTLRQESDVFPAFSVQHSVRWATIDQVHVYTWVLLVYSKVY